MTKKNQRLLAFAVLAFGLYMIYKGKKKSVLVSQPQIPTGDSGTKPAPIALEKRQMFNVVTKTNPLNMRKNPNKTSAIVGQLPKDSIFEGARVKGMPWIAVYDKANKSIIKGFVSSDFVKAGI